MAIRRVVLIGLVVGGALALVAIDMAGPNPRPDSSVYNIAYNIPYRISYNIAYKIAFDSAYNTAYDKAFSSGMRDSCVRTANESLRQRGEDPSTPAMAKRVGDYCDCTVDQAKTNLTRAELAALAADSTAEPASSKLREIGERCVAQVRGAS